MKLSEFVKAEYGKSISECTNEELYYALLTLTKKMASGKQHGNSKKKLYYISAEFLIGKLLSNNLINLGIYDEVKEELAQNGKDICEIEEFENEPSLGNGGLGRLAACFIDSIATLGLNGDGVGLNYHFGLFRQIFENNMQTTVPDPWLTEKSWLTKMDVTYDIKFKGMTVKSRMYDIDVIGYNNTSNKLHLFDVESVDESIVEDGINFNKEDIKKNLTLFLYPDDSDEAGRILRIYQQYFMVSSAAQLILDECVAKGCNLHDLSDYVVIQINDTHPTMVIPELIRLLVERGLEMDEAIEAVTKSCAYTNHTILAEALEKWPIYYLKKAVPQLMPIIEVLDDKVRRKYHNQAVYIIDGEERVHMAHIDIHYSSLQERYEVSQTRNIILLKYLSQIIRIVGITAILMLISLQIVFILNNRREYGIMYAIGFSKRDIFCSALFYNAIISIVAFLLVCPCLYWIAKRWFASCGIDYIVKRIFLPYMLPVEVGMIVLVLLVISIVTNIILHIFTPVRMIRSE